MSAGGPRGEGGQAHRPGDDQVHRHRPCRVTARAGDLTFATQVRVSDWGLTITGGLGSMFRLHLRALEPLIRVPRARYSVVNWSARGPFATGAPVNPRDQAGPGVGSDWRRAGLPPSLKVELSLPRPLHNEDRWPAGDAEPTSIDERSLGHLLTRRGRPTGNHERHAQPTHRSRGRLSSRPVPPPWHNEVVDRLR